MNHIFGLRNRYIIVSIIWLIGCTPDLGQDAPNQTVKPIEKELQSVDRHSDQIPTDEHKYWLVVDSSDATDLVDDLRRKYENDDTFIISGTPLGGAIILFVNGSPVAVFASQQIVDISPWLQRGVNRITFQSQSKQPFYVKVFRNDVSFRSRTVFVDGPTTRKFTARNLIGKLLIEDLSNTTRLDFASTHSGIFAAQCDVLKDDDVINPQLIEEHQTALHEIVELWNRRNAKEIVDSRLKILHHPKLRESAKDLLALNDRSLLEEQTRKVVEDPSFEITIDPREMRCVWGKRSVMCYSGITTSEYRDDDGIVIATRELPFAFSVGSGKNTVHFPPFMFIRVDGTWLVQ